MDSGVSRGDWLLLLLDRESLGAAGPDALDPIRIQKGLFLLSQRGPAAGLYDFRPYNWGPFSSDVYSDLDELTARGYLESSQVPGRTWATYTVTPAGHAQAAAVADQVGGSSISWLRSAREFLTTRSFAQLLRDIYAEYPDYARNSHFAG